MILQQNSNANHNESKWVTNSNHQYTLYIPQTVTKYDQKSNNEYEVTDKTNSMQH